MRYFIYAGIIMSNSNFSPQGNILSVDYDTLSDLPEYENCVAGEPVTGVSS